MQKQILPSASQIKKDARALYGALLSACQIGVGRRMLIENRSKQDGICSWCQLVKQYETDGNRNVRIKKLDNVITTVFHRHYRDGLVKWIQDYEDAFTEFSWIKWCWKILSYVIILFCVNCEPICQY